MVKKYLVEGMYGTNQKSFETKKNAKIYAQNLSNKDYNKSIGVKLYKNELNTKYEFYKKGEKIGISKNPYMKIDNQVLKEQEKMISLGSSLDKNKRKEMGYPY